MGIFKSRVAKAVFTQAWLLGLAAGTGQCWANAAMPIGLSGWNADVIYLPGVTNETVQSFDGSGYAWFVEGYYPPSTAFQGSGLPSSADTTTFGSAANDTCNPDRTQYQFQPFTGNNVLKLGSPADPGQTLTLSTPEGYNNLAIIAASGNTGVTNYTSTFTLTFSDGSTSGPITYDPYDWGEGGKTTQQAAQQVFSTALGRTPTGNTYGSPQDAGYFNMYETDINLTELTSSDLAADSAKFIKSITFATPSGGRVGVFAISGVQNTSATDPLPEPSAAGLLIAAAVPLLLRRNTGGWARR